MINTWAFIIGLIIALLIGFWILLAVITKLEEQYISDYLDMERNYKDEHISQIKNINNVGEFLRSDVCLFSFLDVCWRGGICPDRDDERILKYVYQEN